MCAGCWVLFAGMMMARAGLADVRWVLGAGCWNDDGTGRSDEDDGTGWPDDDDDGTGWS